MYRIIKHLFAFLTIAVATRAFAAIDAPPQIAPDQALTQLKDGNARFVADQPKAPHRDAGRRVDQAKNGQHPIATVVACSDSREAVEILFDQGIGDLFIVRVAGNVCNTDEIASAEYGAEHLGAPLLIVLGHTKCGAVTAAVTGTDVHGNIPALLKGITPAVEKTRKDNPELKDDALVAAAIEANVRLSIANLYNNSEVLRKLISTEKVRIEGAVYDLATGQVNWLSERISPEEGNATTNNMLCDIALICTNFKIPSDEKLTTELVKAHVTAAILAELEKTKSQIKSDEDVHRPPSATTVEWKHELETMLNYQDAWGAPLQFNVDGDKVTVTAKGKTDGKGRTVNPRAFQFLRAK